MVKTNENEIFIDGKYTFKPISYSLAKAYTQSRL